MKNICFITSSRADYDLIKTSMSLFKESVNFKLQLIVTGSHLIDGLGHTSDQIVDEGFSIDKEILLDEKTDLNNIIKNFSSSIEEFSNCFTSLRSDAVVLLGDRYEILSASLAAFLNSIPIIHLHGGELTLDSQDDTFRHCITKLSSLHFVAHNDYKTRVVQLGEDPMKVHNVGPLALDNLRSLKLLGKSELEEAINFRLKEKNILITFHPETTKPIETLSNLESILNALGNFDELGLIFTSSNMDLLGQKFNSQIKNFVNSHKHNSVMIPSMGSDLYLSAMSHSDCVLGNSSSGIIEAPFFGTLTINIGLRQEGRVKYKSVIDCNANSKDLTSLIEAKIVRQNPDKNMQKEYQYLEKSPSEEIYKIINQFNFSKSLPKIFFDLSP